MFVYELSSCGFESSCSHINYFTVFAATKPRSESAVAARLELSDFPELAFIDFVSLAGYILSFPSFHFIFCFLQVFWSKFAQVFLEENQPLLNNDFCFIFHHQCHFHLALYVFFSLQIFNGFFLISWAFFFVVDTRLSFLSIYFRSTFTLFKSLCKVFKKLLIFRKLFTA